MTEWEDCIVEDARARLQALDENNPVRLYVRTLERMVGEAYPDDDERKRRARLVWAMERVQMLGGYQRNKLAEDFS